MWLGGFAERMGICSSVRVDLRAVLRRLVLAKEKGFGKLTIKVDSSVVVSMLHSNTLCSAKYEAIV